MALTAATALAQMEGWSRLDPVVDAYRRVLAPDGPAAMVPDLAEQARQWLGHPSHPAFAQLSAGLLLSAGIADWLPGTGTAVPALTTAGLLSAVPTALTGWGDWASLSRPHARVGVVHAGLNVTALAAFSASLLARARGNSVRGKGWGALGTGLLGASAVIGGHLATVAATVAAAAPAEAPAAAAASTQPPPAVASSSEPTNLAAATGDAVDAREAPSDPPASGGPVREQPADG